MDGEWKNREWYQGKLEEADLRIAAAAERLARLEVAAAWVRDGLRRPGEIIRSPYAAEMAARLDAALRPAAEAARIERDDEG